MKGEYFLAVVGGFTAGIFFRSFFDLGISFVFFTGFLAVSLFVFRFLADFEMRGRILLLSLFLFSAALGIGRMEIKDMHSPDPAFGDFEGRQVVAEGVVVAEPDERASSQRLVVLLDMLEKKAVREKVLAVADRFPSVSYGDRISVAGELKKPDSFETDSGRLFDYPAYLAKDDIYYEIGFGRVAVLQQGEGNVLVVKLLFLKQMFLESIGALIPEPHSSLLGGLLLGAKKSIGEELEREFRTVGLIHIVVLSGYNLTIIAQAAMRTLSFLPQFAGLMTGAFSIILFALMTGASATVVRASIMALLVLLAQSLSRRYDITRSLLLAGALMLLHNPAILVFDPSFQLSFLATVGLIYLSPLVERFFLFMPERFGLRQIIGATIATQVVVLPLLLYQTGLLSLVSLPANLLVLPIIPLAMFLGFVAGIAGMLGGVLALPFAFLAYLPLQYVLSMSHFFSSLPFASLSLPPLPGTAVFICYGLYALLLLWFLKRKEKKRLFAALSSSHSMC